MSIIIADSSVNDIQSFPNYFHSRNYDPSYAISGSKRWVRIFDQVSTHVGEPHISWIYSRTLKKGLRFRDYVLQETVTIGFDVSTDSVVVTLLTAGFSESGDNEVEALINLFSFLTDILDERRDNPKISLGCKLKQQMTILNKLFRYVPTNH